MSLVLEYFFNCILTIAEIIVWINISKKQVELKKRRTYIFVFILITLTFFISNILNDFVNALGIMIISIFFCKLLLKISIRESILLSFIGELLIILSESVFAIFVTSFLKIDIETLAKHIYITNFFVAILIILLSNISYISKIYEHINHFTKYIKLHQLLVFLLFTIFGIAYIYAATYFKISISIMIIVNIFISFFYSVIVILIFRYQNRYYEINSKYNLRLDDLYVQEELINDYRIMNHENKNNLKTIRSMTNDESVKGFISSLLKYDDTNQMTIINDSLKLPSKGIRALLYNKIKAMKDNNIDYSLEVDKKIKVNTLQDVSDIDIVDLCQLLGVFIDNSIESVVNMNQKSIIISFYIEDDKLIITISNCYKDSLLINKDSSLESTKGLNRGYGLKLAKRIVENNNKITNNLIVTKNMFTQKIEFELKK